MEEHEFQWEKRWYFILSLIGFALPKSKKTKTKLGNINLKKGMIWIDHFGFVALLTVF